MIPHFGVCSGMQGVVLVDWFVFHTLLQVCIDIDSKKLDFESLLTWGCVVSITLTVSIHSDIKEYHF